MNTTTITALRSLYVTLALAHLDATAALAAVATTDAAATAASPEFAAVMEARDLAEGLRVALAYRGLDLEDGAGIANSLERSAARHELETAERTDEMTDYHVRSSRQKRALAKLVREALASVGPAQVAA